VLRAQSLEGFEPDYKRAAGARSAGTHMTKYQKTRQKAGKKQAKHSKMRQKSRGKKRKKVGQDAARQSQTYWLAICAVIAE
jgi:hypothetical protein